MNIRLCRQDDEANWISLNREFMNYEIKDDSPWATPIKHRMTS